MKLITAAFGCFTLLIALAHAGPLAPPAAPASTPNPAEARTPISPPASYPVLISAPGSYYLTGNMLEIFGASAIIIQVDDVTLDLNGFTLSNSSPADINAYSGIVINGARVVVRNGSLRSWPGYNIYSVGTDNVFEDLRLADATTGALTASGSSCRISRCVASGSFGQFHVGVSGIIEDCQAHDGAGIGIQADNGSIVSRCNVATCGTGILLDAGGIVRDCLVRSASTGISGGPDSLIQNNRVTDTVLYGINVGNGSNVEDNTISHVRAGGGGVAIHTVGGGAYNRFERNTIVDCDGGISALGNHNFFDQNTFLNVTSWIGNSGGNVLGPLIVPGNSTTTATSTWNAQP